MGFVFVIFAVTAFPKFFKIPGRASHTNIPLVRETEQSELAGLAKMTLEWVIYVTVGGKPAELELFGISFGSFRHTVGFSVNQLLAGADTRFADLVVIVQLNTFSPLFEQSMCNGSLIEVIIIKRFGWIKGELKVTEEHTFSICYIVGFSQVLDFVVLKIRTCEKVEKFTIFGQDGNNDVGSVISSASSVTGLFSTGT
jgi:hypothetical protein